jgi:hypothetical protein
MFCTHSGQWSLADVKSITASKSRQFNLALQHKIAAWQQFAIPEGMHDIPSPACFLSSPLLHDAFVLIIDSNTSTIA